MTYLLLLYRVIVTIYTCQGLRIPPKLVVARVCVDDRGAVVAPCDFGGALWVCLGGAENEKTCQNGGKEHHGGFMRM